MKKRKPTRDTIAKDLTNYFAYVERKDRERSKAPDKIQAVFRYRRKGLYRTEQSDSWALNKWIPYDFKSWFSRWGWKK